MSARWLSFAASAVALASAAHAAPTAEGKRFDAIASAEYRWRQDEQAPAENTPKGTTLHLPDVGPQAEAARLARWIKVEGQLSGIHQTKLDPQERINFAVYKQQVDALLAAQRFRDYEKPFNADTSFWGDVAEWPRGDFKDEAAYRNYLAMLREIPRYYDQQIVNMRAGLDRGFTAPRVTLAGRDDGIVRIVNAGSPDQSPFYAPFRTIPATIPAATQAALRGQAITTIREAVVPAHAKLLAFLRDDYAPRARTTVDAYSLPDGRAYYRSKIREFVTLDKLPEEIHATGLAEVARIRAQMQQVMTEVGFKGDLPAFFHYLRTDPRFYAKTPEELLYRAAWIAKTFDGKASQWFGRLPRSRFAIKPVPPEIAPFYTGGRGGPGIYLVNTYDLPSRPLFAQVALTLHESAPGHAMQMPLAAENKGLPDYRRNEFISAYGEGWAVYCEALGQDMGMYETPYDRFGMLSYQMWRAARLVVDTGIHTQGWSRAQAQRYLHDNTAMADHEIETEVDRYISWPGQALSYYMGELTIQADRKRAEAALGPKFNIRAFHDAVLELGSVPLPLVDARIDRLIAEGGKGPYPDEE